VPAVALVGPWAATRRPAAATHPKAVLATNAGHRLELPFAPVEAELGGVAYTYAIVPRAGRKALVIPDAAGLRTLSFELFIGRPDHQQAIEDLLHTLRTIAAGAYRVSIRNLGQDVAQNAWRLTGYTQRTTLRQFGTNSATRATVPLEFVEASDVAVKVGPVSGGAKTSPAAKPGGAKTSGATTYVVKRGDTLSSIAQHYYGDGSKWPTIAKASGVRDPRKLAVGQRLTIPAKP
jgi:LysM repeat protein